MPFGIGIVGVRAMKRHRLLLISGCFVLLIYIYLMTAAVHSLSSEDGTHQSLQDTENVQEQSDDDFLPKEIR